MALVPQYGTVPVLFTKQFGENQKIDEKSHVTGVLCHSTLFCTTMLTQSNSTREISTIVVGVESYYGS